MDPNNYCILMAGGIGARFWPMSRTNCPKQFIDVLGTGETLIQQTYRRLSKVCQSKNIFIVTNELYSDIIKEQIPGITDRQILCEPSRRNTAPCIAYAAYKINAENPNANIVVSPADHIILREEEFTESLLTALDAASKNNWLLTLGITPSRPDTGYGYIQYTDIIDTGYKQIRKVKTFTEKPQLEMAMQFLESGDFLWNSGIFIWSLSSLLTAMKQQLPDINDIFSEGAELYFTEKEKDFIHKAYSEVRNISIDYGLMEKASNVYVMAADFGWSDLGTWGSLYESRSKDMNGNAIIGNSVMTYDTRNCIVNMPKNKLAVIQGLEDYIIVEDKNMLLIIRKQDEQLIRNIVEDVRERKGDNYI
ncbi:MAG: mannose-1-phosphate guanylyltransferase [Bacteroidota bacterium]|nr:mannose-1-phosphate guanylyltransferase [Bacteroidota bacterium]